MGHREIATANMPHRAQSAIANAASLGYRRPKPVRVLRTKLLFLCSRNQWRSPTAEALFRDHPRYEARSAGTENSARIKVTPGHVGWADVIFCMEKKHAARVQERFPDECAGKQIIVLRIPDDFRFMDPALVELLQSELAAHLEL